MSAYAWTTVGGEDDVWRWFWIHEVPAVSLHIDNDFETTAADEQQERGSATAALCFVADHQSHDERPRSAP